MWILARRWQRLAQICLVGCGIWAAIVRPAAAADVHHWLDEDSLLAQLRQPVSVSLSKTPLRGSLQRFGRSQRIGVFLDRRIDPDQRVELSVVSQPLDTAVQRIAGSAQLGVARLGTTFYYGPPSTTDYLATIAVLRREEIQRLSGRARDRLMRVRSWQWNDLTTPGELLDELAQEARISWQGAQQIPHDLWPLADLPPLAWADRLTIVLAGFGLTFHVASDGETVEIAPWPAREKIAYQKRYPSGAQTKRLAKEFGGQFAQTKIAATGNELTVTGRYEDHLLIQASIPGARKPPKTIRKVTSEERYTLSVKDVPLRKLLDTIAEKLKLQVELDEAAIAAAGISLDQPVGVTVEKATLDELFRRALSGTELTHRIDGSTVTIRPAITLD